MHIRSSSSTSPPTRPSTSISSIPAEDLDTTAEHDARMDLLELQMDMDLEKQHLLEMNEALDQ